MPRVAAIALPAAIAFTACATSIHAAPAQDPRCVARAPIYAPPVRKGLPGSFIPLPPRCPPSSEGPAAAALEADVMGWVLRPDPTFTEAGLRDGVARIFDAAAAASEANTDGRLKQAPNAGFTHCFTGAINDVPGVGCRAEWRTNPAPAKAYAEMVSTIVRQRLSGDGWAIDDWQPDLTLKPAAGEAAGEMAAWTWFARRGARLVVLRREDARREGRSVSSEVTIFVGR
jgi:hypothetical protein